MGLSERKWRKSTSLLILGAGLVLFSLIFYASRMNGHTLSQGIPYFVCGLLFFGFGLRRRTRENRTYMHDGSPRAAGMGSIVEGDSNE